MNVVLASTLIASANPWVGSTRTASVEVGESSSGIVMAGAAVGRVPMTPEPDPSSVLRSRLPAGCDTTVRPNVSSASSIPSGRMLTDTCWVVSPGAKTSTPDTGV